MPSRARNCWCAAPLPWPMPNCWRSCCAPASSARARCSWRGACWQRPTRGGFGGIAGLLHASGADLARIKGLGPASAPAAGGAGAGAPALAEAAGRARRVRTCPMPCVKICSCTWRRVATEVFAVLFPGQPAPPAGHGGELFRGTLTQMAASIRARSRCAPAPSRRPPSSWRHNHPSGSVQPSRADEALTKTLKAALALVDVRVLDHFIVAPGQRCRWRNRAGFLRPQRCGGRWTLVPAPLAERHCCCRWPVAHPTPAPTAWAQAARELPALRIIGTAHIAPGTEWGASTFGGIFASTATRPRANTC